MALELSAEVERTQHPDAQWFPLASFGLFMHWGPSSVAGIQPSWAMIKDYPAGGDARFHPPQKYYALAKEWDPQDYDPNRWLDAASRAGCTYAVLTTKHHDGYALWPTAYGDMSTRQYMGGRDLLAPYVEACRRQGLKVGLYFSFADWHYPDYPIGDVGYDYNKRGQYEPYDPQENRERFEDFYAYSRGQLEELLTRYGKIDLLWFDGVNWPGIDDFYTAETLGWIRELQPGIVLNNRWRGAGDYGTPECRFPQERPENWWELCHIWQGGHGGWGYSRFPVFRPLTWVMENLVRCRAWGGNFLCNVGPGPSGRMHDEFYQSLDQLAAWMEHSRQSVIGAVPVPEPERANVPLTRPAGGEPALWYAHLLADHVGEAVVSPVAEPASVRLLRTGDMVAHGYANRELRISLPAEERTELNDVLVITWQDGAQAPG